MIEQRPAPVTKQAAVFIIKEDGRYRGRAPARESGEPESFLSCRIQGNIKRAAMNAGFALRKMVREGRMKD